MVATTYSTSVIHQALKVTKQVFCDNGQQEVNHSSRNVPKLLCRYFSRSAKGFTAKVHEVAKFLKHVGILDSKNKKKRTYTQIEKQLPENTAPLSDDELDSTIQKVKEASKSVLSLGSKAL